MRLPPQCILSLSILLGYLVTSPVRADEHISEVKQSAMVTPKLCHSSLEQLALPTLAATLTREATPVFEYVATLAEPGDVNEYTRQYFKSGASPTTTYILSFTHQGLRQYARLDLPAGSDKTTPLIVYNHGYVGYPASIDFQLAYDIDSMSGEFIASWIEASFAVLSPGYRGHGTFQERPSDGAEFLELWDMGSAYLTPTFYAMDILAAVRALPSLIRVIPPGRVPKIDRIALIGHSQGGDATLTALALDALQRESNLSRDMSPKIVAGSLWAGCVGDRLAQLELYNAVKSRSAFLAGDGVWRRSAVGATGQINPDYRWPWPQPWSDMRLGSNGHYEFADAQLTNNSVIEEIESARQNLLKTVRQCSPNDDLSAAAEKVRDASGYRYAQHIQIPIHLHSSDQDYYSPPQWNGELADRLQAAGTKAAFFLHSATTHALKVSEKKWFSPATTTDGLSEAIKHDAALFRGVIFSEN